MIESASSFRGAVPTVTPDRSPERAAAPDRTRERAWVLAGAVTLTVLRCATLVGFEGPRFDSDQALIGLMTKHLIEGRAFPVFTYGQPYMLGVEAWLAVPFFLVGGATAQMLKMPLLLVNVAIAAMLVRGIERATGLRPMLALVPALFFILAAPGTATLLLEASGGNVEPFLMVLVLWAVRRRPFAFGAVLAFGVLQREFTIYALGALAMLRVVDGTVFRRDGWRPIFAGMVSFGAMWQGVYLLKQFSSINGPGTSAEWAPLEASANLAALAGRVCVDTSRIASSVAGLATSHLADLFGASDRDMAAFTINSQLHQGAPWLWPVLGSALALGFVRVAYLAFRQGRRPWSPPLEFPSYLLLVGLQAILIYAVVRCGQLGIAEMRYSLLGVFGAVGLTAALLTIETSRLSRAAAVAVVLLWSSVMVASHGRLASQYVFDPPVNPRRVLADTLVKQGVRFAYADFWDAYIVSFLTNEQVIVATRSFVFIDEYQWIVDRRSDEAVHINHEPCPGGTAIALWLHVCPAAGGAQPPPRGGEGRD
jgi:hypothetical protein